MASFGRCAGALVAVVAATGPMVPDAAAALDGPGCFIYSEASQTQVLSPLPSPLRSTEGNVLRLRVPDLAIASRRDFVVRIRNTSGSETSLGLDQFTAVARDRNGVIYEVPLQFPGDLATWTLSLSETVRDDLIAEDCLMTSERAFLAGGAPVQSSHAPSVSVQATMRDPLREANSRAFDLLVFTDSGYKVLLTTRARVTCTVGDDGLGNPVVPASTLRIVPPRAAGAAPTSATVCATPPGTAIGTAWTEEISRRYQVKVRANRNSLRRWPWSVSLGGTRVAGGVFSIRHSEYDRGYVRRVYSTDFDAYWNVCVNQGRKVWASGGRLYCIAERLPASSTATIRLTGR